jgi:hypothetical protein
MLLNFRNIIMLLFVSSMACNNPQIEQGTNSTDDYRQLNVNNIDFSYIAAIQGVKHTLPFTRYLFENVSEIPEFSNSATQSFINSKNDIQSLFHYSYQLLSSSAGGFGPPLPGASQSKSIRNQNDLDKFFEIPGVNIIQRQEWEKLPFSFRKGIVEILFCIDEAKMIFEQFSKPVQEYLNEKSAFSTSEMYDELMLPWNQRELNELSSVDLIKDADLKKLSFATRKLAEKLNWFFMLKELQIPEDFTNCSIKSCMGELLINGTKNDTIKGEHFFVVELGGDDVYLGNTASTISCDQPLGIVVDLKGNDKYLCNDNYLVAGILGMAVLLDLEGDDFYQTSKPGLAFSLYGSSLLYDYSGNDEYLGSNYCQAASYIGVSLMVDILGDDKYSCLSNSQAFGGTLGVGIFYDNHGNDLYNSANIAGTENNFSQNFILGAAKGRWAEATDGQSLAGGIGFFSDNSGIDHYAAGSFSQGASYYFGLGLFNDKNGDDEYNAISHSQGYAAHYSLAGFFERKGDDTYNAQSPKDEITQIIGCGRDFSVGLFMEFDGDDTYHFGNRSAGIGDINGIGLLADFNGNDEYVWHKNSLNSGSQSLGKEPGLGESMNIGFKIFQPKDVVNKGIFIDSKGTNIYK